MKKLKKPQISLTKSRIFLLVSILAVTVIAVGSLAYFTNSKQLAYEQTVKSADQALKESLAKTAALAKAKKAQPQPTPASQTQPTQTQTNTTSAQTGSSAASAPKSNSFVAPAPNIPAFKIDSIAMNGAYYLCSGGVIVTYISSAYFTASNAQGGTFSWKIEGENSQEIISTPVRTETIPYNQSSLNVSGSTPSTPGFLYSDMGALPGERIRIKTVGPNVAYSAWLQIPENYVCN